MPQWPRIVQLVLYSPDPHYDQMYAATRSFYHIPTWYYFFDPHMPASEGDVQLDGDKLRIRGEESFLPGILDKTMRAIAYVTQHMEFDYLIRSNVSTVVHIARIALYLAHTPVDYGGWALNLRWLDPKSGIVDRRHEGTTFVSGTCIILSHRTAQLLVQRSDLVDRRIIDDVAIAVFMKQMNIPVHSFTSHFLVVNPLTPLPRQIGQFRWIFRHKTANNRDADVRSIQQTVQSLQSDLAEVLAAIASSSSSSSSSSLSTTATSTASAKVSSDIRLVPAKPSSIIQSLSVDALPKCRPNTNRPTSLSEAMVRSIYVKPPPPY